MADCRIVFDCSCACVELVHVIQGGGIVPGYYGALHPYLLYETNYMKLTGTTPLEDPRCDCHYTGTTRLYYDGIYGDEDYIDVTLEVTVHDSSKVWVRMTIQDPGELYNNWEYRNLDGAVGWEYKYDCPGYTPPDPTTIPFPSEGGAPYLIEPSPPPKYDIIELTEVSGNTEVPVYVRFGGVECCKKQCVTKMDVDLIHGYGVPHLSECTPQGPICPTVEVQEFPFAKAIGGNVASYVPPKYWDAPWYWPEDEERYLKWFSTREDKLWNENDMSGEHTAEWCEADCCDLFTKEDYNGGQLHHEEDWWEVVTDDFGVYDIGTGIDDENIWDNIVQYCSGNPYYFYWCGTTYLVCGGATLNFRFKGVPCDLGDNCKIYAMNAQQEILYEIDPEGSEVPTGGYLDGGSAIYLEFRSTRRRLYRDPSTNELYCDTENGTVLAEDYEHTCATKVSGRAPVPVTYMVPRCMIVKVSGSGDGIDGFFQSYGYGDWYNGETRVIPVGAEANPFVPPFTDPVDINAYCGDPTGLGDGQTCWWYPFDSFDEQYVYACGGEVQMGREVVYYWETKNGKWVVGDDIYAYNLLDPRLWNYTGQIWEHYDPEIFTTYFPPVNFPPVPAVFDWWTGKQLASWDGSAVAQASKPYNDTVHGFDQQWDGYQRLTFIDGAYIQVTWKLCPWFDWKPSYYTSC